MLFDFKFYQDQRYFDQYIVINDKVYLLYMYCTLGYKIEEINDHRNMTGMPNPAYYAQDTVITERSTFKFDLILQYDDNDTRTIGLAINHGSAYLTYTDNDFMNILENSPSVVTSLVMMIKDKLGVQLTDSRLLKLIGNPLSLIMSKKVTFSTDEIKILIRCHKNGEEIANYLKILEN